VGVVIPQPSGGVKYPLPKVTIALIVANVIAYLVTTVENGLLSISNYWLLKGAFIPILILNPYQWYRFITSMFLHAGLFHIFFNMLYLYYFGKAVEMVLGGRRYLLLYFASGILADLFHMAFIPIEGPASAVVPAIGASGAISGILGSYLVLFPNSKISVCFFYFFFPVCFAWNAAGYLVFWFVTQVVEGYLGHSLGIAVFAHIGGFLGGLALLPILLDRDRHRLVRALVGGRGYLYHVYAGNRGLGKLSKLVLALAIISIIAGSAYSAFSAKGVIEGVRVLNFRVKYGPSYAGAFKPKYFDEEPVTIRIINGRVDLLSSISADSVRIVFNRLRALGFLYGKAKGGTIFVNKLLTAKVLGYSLRVNLNMEATYDEEGYLIKAKGIMTTDVLTCLGFNCYISGSGTFSFVIYPMYGGGGKLEGTITTLSLLSSVISLLALDNIIRRSDELSIYT